MLAIVREEDRAALEGVIAAHCADQAWTEAATAAIRGYGPEILGYLFAATRRDQDTAEVFSDVCEDLWRGLPGFRGESSFRTWLYRLAFHAQARAGRTGARRRKRVVAYAEVPEVEELVEHVRTRTLPHLRTDMKTEIMRLRQQLDDDEQTMLILRIDRRLEWEEIARIIDTEASSPADIKRLSATLRKRFERTKARLRELSKGLLPEE
jgi:RNA polymerase sigma-70 factor, ECF subfamily